MTKILVTGAAGFIGYSVCQSLLSNLSGDSRLSVMGLDNLNTYYSVDLKKSRLQQINDSPHFEFHSLDICDHDKLADLINGFQPDVIIHLAAQAGVRNSIINPFDYARSNLLGHLSILEACRHCTSKPRLIYASSSSVYGGNECVPFSEDDAVDQPVSLYAATKRADELMSSSYAHLYDIEQIGLRFFTVYGPWGRPDMAYWSFTQKIIKGEPIPVFNNGEMKRDLTYIDDIVNGVLFCVDKKPSFKTERPHRVYNIGNNTPVPLMDFIHSLEVAIGKEAVIDYKPMQPGDVYETHASIDRLSNDYGYQPSTTMEIGIPKFVEWYRAYHNV